MTRTGFLLFNALLVATLYGVVYFTGAKPNAISYTLTFFSAPYIALNILLAFIAMLRWYMAQNPDVVQEGITFLHAAWITALFTFIAYKIVSGEVHIPFLKTILH